MEPSTRARTTWSTPWRCRPMGRILMGGIFTVSLRPNATTGTPRNRSGGSRPHRGIQTLTLTGGGTVETWMRSGGGPEVSRVTFEFSFDGSFYSLLGNGTRIAGGWELTTGEPADHATLFIRARGYYETGQNGSGSIAESILIEGCNTTPGDFDGDGKADLVVFRPSSGTWYVLASLTGSVVPVSFGFSGDLPFPAITTATAARTSPCFAPAQAPGTSSEITWTGESSLGPVAMSRFRPTITAIASPTSRSIAHLAIRFYVRTSLNACCSKRAAWARTARTSAGPAFSGALRVGAGDTVG